MSRFVSMAISMILTVTAVSLTAFAAGLDPANRAHPESDSALDYLRGLQGRWVVQGGDEGSFGWEFDVTSRGGVVVERLKVGTATEMATVYHLDNDDLVASHFCQLGNQPRLTAVTSEAEGDLHFVCDGDVGGTDSHEELHMHGVHFQKKGDSLLIWMDMLEKGEVAFQTSYELVRADEPHGHTETQELGVVDFPVSCSAPAQEPFNRAVALLHHMTYLQAKVAFERVAELDPECAMAHWGIAMTLFQPTWPTRPSPDDLQRGWEAAQTAIEIGSPSELENLFIATAEAFFLEPTATDYWLRVRRWEEAMAAVHSAFPESHDAAAFYALAHLAVAPADQASNENSERAADLLLAIYDQNPEHPGAMHYMVHANDAPGRERKLLEIVRKYETVAPNNPHALHMPTHIYTRLGDWDGVIRGNLRAAEAALLHPAGTRGELVSDEFPHAIEYLVYAYLQQGADDQAAAELQRLLETSRMQPSFKTAFHLASTQARYTLERRAWNEAAALVPRDAPGLDWDRFRWPEAISWFARGLGSARQGRFDEARRATARLGELERSARAAGESLFARNIRILELEMDAWIAHGGGELDSAAELMQQAAKLEASTPKHAVTPGPTLPAWEQLGDLFLEQDRAEESLAAYEEALELYPGRLNSLLGAARAARAGEDLPRATARYRALLEGAADGARPTVVQEARDYVSGSPPMEVSASEDAGGGNQ